MTGPKFGLAPAQQNMDHAPDKKIGLKIRTRVRSSVQWTTLSAPVNRQSVSNWGPNRPVIPSFIASFDFSSFSSLFLFFISSSFLFCLLSTSSSSFYWFSNKPIRMQYSSNRQISRLKWCWWQGYIGDKVILVTIKLVKMLVAKSLIDEVTGLLVLNDIVKNTSPTSQTCHQPSRVSVTNINVAFVVSEVMFENKPYLSFR